MPQQAGMFTSKVLSEPWKPFEQDPYKVLERSADDWSGRLMTHTNVKQDPAFNTTQADVVCAVKFDANKVQGLPALFSGGCLIVAVGLHLSPA
jgi:hypothetical protein